MLGLETTSKKRLHVRADPALLCKVQQEFLRLGHLATAVKHPGKLNSRSGSPWIVVGNQRKQRFRSVEISSRDGNLNTTANRINPLAITRVNP